MKLILLPLYGTQNMAIDLHHILDRMKKRGIDRTLNGRSISLYELMKFLADR
jgi:hypothetical protein